LAAGPKNLGKTQIWQVFYRYRAEMRVGAGRRHAGSVKHRQKKFPDSVRKGYYLMSIHDQVRQIPAPEIEKLG
jgi:hypothetical protein